MENSLVLFFSFIIIFVIAVFAVYLLFTIIGFARILKKGGKDWWISLIPFYNIYTLCEVCGVNPRWIFLIIIGSFFSFFPLLNIFVTVLCFYFQIVLNVSLAKSFGKEPLFAIGLILLPPVFYFILSSSEYIGPDPMEDYVFNFIDSKTNNKYSVNNNSNNNSNNNTNNNSSTVDSSFTTNTTFSYCSNCGNKLTDDSIYCANCGNKVK
jgi:hypothetical protein